MTEIYKIKIFLRFLSIFFPLNVPRLTEGDDTVERRLLTVKEAAQLIDGLTEYRIRQMCKNGELTYIAAGRKILISENVLLQTVLGADINNKET